MGRFCSIFSVGLIAAWLAGCAATSPLARAAAQGDAAQTKALLDGGADVNAASSCPGLRRVVPPLICAVNAGKEETVKLLLDRGANTEGIDGGANTALLYAGKNFEISKLLIDKGADVNIKSRMGDTPLGGAARSSNEKLVRLLIERGAEIDPALPMLRDCSTGANWTSDSHAPCAAGLNMLEKFRRASVRKNPANELPSTGISKEDISTIVQAAVEGAVKAKDRAADLAIGAASDIDRPAHALPERPNDFAIVVGIGKYSDIPEAQYADRDGETVKNHLLALGFPSRNVVHLTGEKAGYKGIEKFVETWLPKNVDENSRVVFYFSGHGAPDAQTGQAYLLPYDGDPSFLENTGYPIKRLYEKLGSLKAREVVVVMDACFSGAGGRSVLAKGARPLVMKVDTATVPRNLTVFAAASGDQITSTLEDQGHGTFTYYFLKGLSGGAKNGSGAVTTQALYDYLKPKVQDAARRQNRDQEPVLHARGDRELVRF